MSYDALRQLADSWGLVVMGAVFLILIGWTYRPRRRAVSHQRASTMIFENEDRLDG